MSTYQRRMDLIRLFYLLTFPVSQLVMIAMGARPWWWR